MYSFVFFSIPIFCMVSIIFLYFKVKTLFKHCLVMLKLFIDFIFNNYLIFWPMIYHNILTIFLLLDVLVVINVFLNKTFLYLKLVSLGVGNQKNVGESYEHKTNKKRPAIYCQIAFQKGCSNLYSFLPTMYETAYFTSALPT